MPNITDELSIEANSMDPEQTAPIGAVRSGSALFTIEASQTFHLTRKQTTFVVIGALRVNQPAPFSSALMAMVFWEVRLFSERELSYSFQLVFIFLISNRFHPNTGLQAIFYR